MNRDSLSVVLHLGTIAAMLVGLCTGFAWATGCLTPRRLGPQAIIDSLEAPGDVSPDQRCRREYPLRSAGCHDDRASAAG